jgi:hypothetical protein
MISDSKTSEKRLEELREKMLHSYCPINKGYCCDDCIHYNEGHVFDFLDVCNIVEPSCKLWK